MNKKIEKIMVAAEKAFPSGIYLDLEDGGSEFEFGYKQYNGKAGMAKFRQLSPDEAGEAYNAAGTNSRVGFNTETISGEQVKMIYRKTSDGYWKQELPTMPNSDVQSSFALPNLTHRDGKLQK